MKLSNRFSNVDKMRVWLDHNYCILCSSNNMCSLHHITGCKDPSSSSILNSSMLCHDCHKSADGKNVSNVEFQSDLLGKTMKLILKSGYAFKTKESI